MTFQRLPDAPHIGRRKCAWCDRIVVWDDDRQVVSHEAPVCAGFEALMVRAAVELGPGAARELGPEVLPWGSDDGEEPS